MTKQEKPWNNQSMPEYLKEVENNIYQNSATELEEEKLLHEFKKLLLQLFNKNTQAGSVKEDEILSQIEQMKKLSEQTDQSDNIKQELVKDFDSMTRDDIVEHVNSIVNFLEKILIMAAENRNENLYFNCEILIARAQSLPDIFDRDKQEYIKELRDILNKALML